MKQIKLISLSSCFLVIALNSLTPQADTILYTQPPGAEELAEVLFGSESRSINMASTKPKISSSAKIIKSNNGGHDDVGMPIEFAFNSDALLPESIPFLDDMGKAMTMKQHGKILIEGHTDSIGSDSYNLALSQRRARAVSHYLVKKFNVSSSRLKSRGLGENKPLPDYGPEDKVNRRVQFYTAG